MRSREDRNRIREIGKRESLKAAYGREGAMVAKSAIMAFREIIGSILCTLEKEIDGIRMPLEM